MQYRNVTNRPDITDFFYMVDSRKANKKKIHSENEKCPIKAIHTMIFISFTSIDFH